ncbi:Endoribonuclease L-PSP-domain-containing protein [Achaetomium macrosporum]|uniref:Endoribonuclease L-PSP-domain-containing protein n=1 Tax=Achaetomium macrosporum TaxID=79813 RepID=A0AAN7CHS8_9PEZI|nr:Endoribonuclease L-PSP-domain-containing protein [Achaetomium macrosporum]
MSATPVFTKNAAARRLPASSQAIKTPNAIYCSGQIPCDAEGTLIEGTIQQKTAACIGNLKAVLEEAGSSIEKVVKVNVFLTDMANFANMNEEYAKWFVHKPARSCVAVKQLPKGVDLIMTPLLFISFLLSLTLVDLRHSALRAHYHANANQPSRLPRWLHRIVYRYLHYRYVAVDERGRPGADAESPGSSGSAGSPGMAGRESEDYYHSKQRKLMKLEATEAFEIRDSVLVVLGFVGLGMVWIAWRALSWGLEAMRAWVS